MALQSASAQGGPVFSGQVIDPIENKPVLGANVIIPEARKRTPVDDNGRFNIQLPEAGTYTLYVRAGGYKFYERKIEINENTELTIRLSPAVIDAGTYTAEAERDIQKLSRHTMTVKQLKDVPASFGDSINALTSLPSVIRASRGGFFGPLIIRGAPLTSNAYYIDDIPILNPQHFGGIHSVINNNLMSEIDLYASAFPVQFANATGAIININTVDKVEKFGGYADVGFISSNVLLQAPWSQYGPTDFRGQGESIGPAGPGATGQGAAGDGPLVTDLQQGAGGGQAVSRKKTPNGYWIVSGRVSYISLFAPPLIELITGDEQDQFPEYWDYQAKGKWYLSDHHSLTVLMFGSKDFLVFTSDEDTAEANKISGGDPLFNDFDVDQDILSINQGLYYTYEPSGKFYNRTMLFGSLNDTSFGVNAPDTSIFNNINISSRPYVYGLQNKTRWRWWDDKGELRSGVELRYYDFKADGKTIVPNGQIRDNFDAGNEDLFVEAKINEDFSNQTAGGYIENKFQFGGLKMVPGVRADYLVKFEQSTVDPRGLIAYEFPTRTTISAAGGQYSQFIQVNSAWFNNQPEVAGASNLLPEVALHRSVGVEQKVGLLTFKVEGFYNTFDQILQPDPNPNDPEDLGDSIGEYRTQGAEFMISKDEQTGQAFSWYGWASYTYAMSEQRTNAQSDPLGNQFVVSQFDQRHSVKLVAGLLYLGHKLGARFQAFSSFPYTPTVGSRGPDRVFGRYSKEFGKQFSKRYPMDHTLDIRYSRIEKYSWGTVTWYVEVINIYNHQPVFEDWRYDRPYISGNKNPKLAPADGVALVPNFGVEVSF